MIVRSSQAARRAFSLVELLVVIGIIVILALLGIPTVSALSLRGERIRLMSAMRSVGLGINLYAGEHSSVFPGPLWPGQVAEFSRIEEGRLIVRLAPYLGISEGDSPYLVERFLPPAFRRALPAVAPEEIRVFVMNTAVPSASGNINPWGSLTPAVQPPRNTSSIASASTWAMSEAYASHPAVAARPWKSFTTPAPLYGKSPLGLFFDGSVGFFQP